MPGIDKAVLELDLISAEEAVDGSFLIIRTPAGTQRIEKTQLAIALGAGGGGGLPIQALDLVVEVTSDAEYAEAVANYWNYQFTVAARYVIQFQTGYTITMQLSLDSRHMPNLEFRTQTTTTVDCASFVANALGIKTPFLFVNCELAAFYGTYVGTNGATTSPLYVLGSTLDFWNGNMLAPQTLNMSGFLATGGNGGFLCIGWSNRVPCVVGTLVTLDVHLALQNSSLTGDKFKVGGGVTSLSGGGGHVQIELTSGATGRVSFSSGEYSAQITHQASAYYTYIVGIAASVNLFMSGVTAMRPDPTYNNVFYVGGGSRLGVSLLNTPCVWCPETSGDYFVEAHGEVNITGGNFNIDTTLATPNAIFRADYNSSVSFGLDMDSVAGMFPSGICHDVLSNFIEENTTTSDGALVNTRRGNPSFLSVVPTEAAVVTPDYYPANLSIDAGVSLTATTIDLTNYAKDGLTTTLAFDANTITGVTWTGGTFVGAPASIAGGERYAVTYRASNSTFYFTGAAVPVAETQCIPIACSDETTAVTAGTAKVTFRMPYAFTLQAVRASLTTAQASGSIFTVDINDGISSVLSTKLTIDNTEKTSTSAATPAVISDTALADDTEITIDIDQIGDGTAKGLKVYLIGVKA